MSNICEEHRNQAMYLLTIINYLIDIDISVFDKDLIDRPKVEAKDVMEHVVNTRHHLDYYVLNDRDDINIIDLITIFADAGNDKNMFMKTITNEKFNDILSINMLAILKNTYLKIENKFPNLIGELKNITSVNCLYATMDQYCGYDNLSDLEKTKSDYSLNDDDILFLSRYLKTV